MTLLRTLLVSFVITGLVACGGSKPGQSNAVKSVVVQPTALHKTLYFTGIVQPLKESTLTIPMDAVVETMHFRYGQQVNKGDVVYTLKSAELQRQYNEVLTEYLKAKDTFSMAKAKFTGTQNLWKEGLLAKNNYLSEKSNVDTTRVSLIQASRKLSEMLEKMGDNAPEDLTALSIAEFDKVRSALNSKHNLIQLKAPSAGVLLYPPKSGDDKVERLTVGSAVKNGQLIALIGDLRGIRVEIDVPEVDIDKIHVGMPAAVSGVAFAKERLQGKLVTINAQASTASGSALPSFTAIVQVEELNPEQQAKMKVGMSASIELEMETHDKLSIPIAAVHFDHGKTVVKLATPDGKTHLQPVTTGPAQADQVVIETGLKPGDNVLYE